MSMRTLKRREQAIKWLAPTTTTGALGSVTVSWSGTKTSIKADVQPLPSTYNKVEYGERADRMRLVILPNGAYQAGDGIWLQGETDSDPPWLIVSVEAWQDLTSLTIEKRA